MKKYYKIKVIRILLIAISLSLNHIVSASSDELKRIFASENTPAGVVFEIVDWDDEYLERAVPWVNQQIISLRAQFPGLDIAVVSHGSEQFALLKDANGAYPEIHLNVQRLISDHDVKLELCLGHANMRGFNQGDFPDYVDIEASGPSQIAAYESLGYDKVVVMIE